MWSLTPVHPAPRAQAQARRARRRADDGSAILLLLALTWGGTQYSWVSPEIFALLAASFALSLAFGWRLTRASRSCRSPRCTTR
jgi:hypothetical protein